MNSMFSSEELQGENVLVLGASRSGMAAARLLHEAGANVFVSEIRDADKVESAAAELEALGIPLETGGHRLKGFPIPKFAVVSPGIPSNAPIVHHLKQEGRQVVSEVEVASWFYFGTIIAITGSNGKTTVTRWIEHTLHQADLNAVACGNIGYPFCDMVREQRRVTHAVVEVSSFQLETIQRFHPHVSVMTNLSEDHLDRHGDFESYAKAKSRIWMNQKEEDFTVLPEADKMIASISLSIRPQILNVSLDRVPELGAGVHDGQIWINLGSSQEHVMAVDELSIPGRHNIANALCAAAACRILKLSVDEIKQGLATFPGVPHRLELVHNNGRLWINDSKATNVDSLRVALEAVRGPVILIAGGRDKGAPYVPLRELVKKKVARMLLIGEGAMRLDEELGDLLPTKHVGDLESAVKEAYATAQPGETVLLSPGCASFDQFRDYEQRGDVFRELVEKVHTGQNEAATGEKTA
ncbi:UDP-N-acetylmuramoyl-L-alanine--D-glutamate ligase [bacterium]|nr:UDP-N-acetylmuramoyl-L-alanine--D-glutamate ligase [bacterium]